MIRSLLLGLLLLAVASVAVGQTQALVAPTKDSLERGVELNLPEPLEDLTIEQKPGAQVDLDLEFVDQHNQTVRLGDYFGERPVLLAPVYYECPMLCSLVLDGVIRTLMPLKFDPGEDFEVLAVSFDPRETASDAKASWQTALDRYRRKGAEDGIHFLTGEEQNVADLMKTVGFRYRFDPETGQYAHAGGVILLTPEGKVSRYFYGVDYPSKDVRLGLVEASQNQIGSVVDQVLLFCYQYDPVLGKYSAVTMNIVRLGGVVTVVLLISFILTMLMRERRRHRTA